MWGRKTVNAYAERWTKETGWRGLEILRHTARVPSIIWALTVSAWLAIMVSTIPPDWEYPLNKGLWTLFVLSLALCLLSLTSRLIRFYGERLKMPEQAVIAIRHVARISILIVATLTLLEVWGAPLTPLLLFIGVLALLALFTFRDTGPNLIAALQLSSSQHIKVGDYIKLPETEEEGYVTEMNWRNTVVRSPTGSTTIIPNRKLVQSTVVNYGHPIKKAKEPFRFYARAHLKELTGLKAKNLRELADVLKTVPESVIYYHTHHFLEEHHYLTPQPSNDLSLWVDEALGEETLAERLASVDTFEFTSLQALRERLVGIIEEHLSHVSDLREASEGREFHFVKSVSMILPTPYEANDIREFVESLRQLSPGSLYFHVFESRLRLGRGQNDFSTWLAESLDEIELAERIAKLDPYTYSLEGLRSSLIQLIEKEIG